MKDNIQEDFWCLFIGTIMAIAFIALMLGDGDKGLLDLF